MEEKKLLLCPDYIYYDFTSRKYFGIYYPWESNDAENIYCELMDFLLNHIDTREQKLVEIIYQAYEMSDGQTFSWTDVLRLFENEEEKGNMPKAESIIDNIGNNQETESESVRGSGRDMDTNNTRNMYDSKAYSEKSYTEKVCDEKRYVDDIEDEYYSIEQEKETHFHNKVHKESNRKIYYVFAILSICGIGGGIWVYLNYELTQQEIIVVIAALGVMGLIFLFSLVQSLLSGSKKRKKEQEEEALIRDIEDEFREERAIMIQDVLDKNMNVAAAGHSFSSSNVNRQEEKMYGETVFIDVGKQKIEYKLYALDKKNKKHIELTQFPFTIGKMAGYVDCVLTDDSISRLHARIEKQDEKILLTDMNSMNGTFKNGLRMMPSETVEIEPGDEIRFGKLNYCYR